MNRSPSGFVRKPTAEEIAIAETKAAMLEDLRDATGADDATIEQAALACLHAHVLGDGHELATYVDRGDEAPAPRLRLVKK